MAKSKMVLVLMESLARSGHQYTAVRMKQVADKLEQYKFDPIVRQWVIYREKKKVRTLRTKN